MNSNNLKNLTFEERILLYLLDYNYQPGNYLTSESVSFQGIKEAMNCDLGYLSRIIRSAEKKRYILRKMMKIPSKKRKHNVFFLTKKGRRIALELQEYINKSK